MSFTSKPWAKMGAFCECNGEGRGNVFIIKQIRTSGLGMVWLEGWVMLGNQRVWHVLGWKGLKGCYRSDKARRAEAAGG